MIGILGNQSRFARQPTARANMVYELEMTAKDYRLQLLNDLGVYQHGIQRSLETTTFATTSLL